jgi:serine/threonine protein kinase
MEDIIGQTLSHYKILGKLGSGGMGIVYEAEDISLGRKVALKFLPPELASDPQALQRFHREARAASALNHPNICTIHAIEEHDGRVFIAMELLEGQPLDCIIGERALPLDRFIDLAIQTCDALEVAHSKGVVHRDIKPANIFVTTRNQVKILDFGLAKVSAVTHSMATTAGADNFTLTRAGTAMGTVAYMSPEQARGEDLDARSDIFSFGAVLYQMATHKIPFEGTTTAVVFAGLLEHQPVPVLASNPNLPPQVDEIIRKALEKDRDLRYQTAAELRADLKRLKRDSTTVTVAVTPRVTARPRKPKPLPWAGAAVLLLAAVIGGWLALHKRTPHDAQDSLATAENLPQPASAEPAAASAGHTPSAATQAGSEVGSSQKSKPATNPAAVKPSPATPAGAAALPAASAPMLFIKSDPPGASIALDGRETGKITPAQIATSAGKHSITLHQSGYLPATIPATVSAAASPVSVMQTLKVEGVTKDIKPVGGFRKIFGGGSEKMGRVSLHSSPKGAKVFVGAQLVSKPTPVEFNLNPGSYELTFQLDGYKTLHAEVDVVAGKKVELTEELKKADGQ